MSFTRTAEPEIVMESADCVSAFHDAGRPGGPLHAIYHFNATELSALVPLGGTVVDIFCGSGQLLRHLLVGRPDVRAVGVDLSARMLDTARENLAQVGVLDRVEFIRTDAGDLAGHVDRNVAAIACLSALHHCPTEADLRTVLTAIETVRHRSACAVWLFDLVRPPKESQVELIPRAHELRAGARLDEAFKRDWVTSLRAGWTLEEFVAASSASGLRLRSVEGNYSQLHWCPGDSSPSTPPEWHGPSPESGDLERSAALAAALGFAEAPPR